MVVVSQLALIASPSVEQVEEHPARRRYTSLEICAGAGGTAIGVEEAGFRHLALVEIEAAACATLRLNRPQWNVIQCDLRQFGGWPYVGIDLLSGGVPCPPFSKAGLKQGIGDDRDLFPEALRLVAECKPRAVLLENVPGLMETRFAGYRAEIAARLAALGYGTEWRVLQAADFGVPQLRPRVLCVALQAPIAPYFRWPVPTVAHPVSVGAALRELMAAGGWEGAEEWARQANKVAPTLVGGSKRHGGPDLGPTRARKEWATLGVDGLGLVDAPPPAGFAGMPRLTVEMAAVVQGFPRDWRIVGKKTPAYRQVGNAFPPPVARAVAAAIHDALRSADAARRRHDGARLANSQISPAGRAVPRRLSPHRERVVQVLADY